MDQQIEYYKKKTIHELMTIEPKWAYGKNADKIFDSALKPVNKRYTIYCVETIRLIENSLFLEVDLNNLFTDDYKNNIRISRILSRWDNSDFVDPPIVFISKECKNKLTFYDGRHRTKLAYLLGSTYIPLAIDDSDVSAIKKIINLFNSKNILISSERCHK
jgi:hypothetical protein